MTENLRDYIVGEIATLLDVPDRAYETAVRRYEDIAVWLDDTSNAECAIHKPHIFPQGSFALGTVVRPWKREEFDLDLSCELLTGITKVSHSQAELKELLRVDLEKYRKERQIQQILEAKRRCWRLRYKDDYKFHMDIVPGIPETMNVRQILNERMVTSGTAAELASDVAQMAQAITDSDSSTFPTLSQDWPTSNPQGYVIWFKSRLRQARTLLEARAKAEGVAQIDDVPGYRWKSPLQQCIQLLKRHRDVMFENQPDKKPISIIITTLAARVYSGEADLTSTVTNAITQMDKFVNPSELRVPNPINPNEDFADKWREDEQLELGFRRWIAKLRSDSDLILGADDVQILVEGASRSFGVEMNPAKIRKHSTLLKKSALIMAGSAFTNKDGTIGSEGVKNKPHKFYG